MQTIVKRISNWVRESRDRFSRCTGGGGVRAWIAACIGSAVVCASPVQAQTMVSGGISANTRWTAENGPYVLSGGVVIQNAAILTIDAGVTVFMGQDAELTVASGGIKATGSVANPIRVRSDKTRQGLPAAPGDWKQWTFSTGTINTQLDHVDFENGRGLRVIGSSPIFNNLNVHHQLGAAITVDLSASPSGNGNQASDNTINGIAVPAGDIVGNVLWGIRGIPYVVTSGVVSVGKSPTISSVSPNTLQQSESVTMSVVGKRLSGLADARFDVDGITAQVLAGGSDTQVSLTVSADAAAPIGQSGLTLLGDAGEVRLANAVTVIQSQPVLSSLAPSSVYANQGTVIAMINGRNITAQSTVLVNGSAVPTEFVSATQLKATFNAPVTPGNIGVRVRTPDPLNSGMYLTSNELTLTATSPALLLSPATAAIVKGSTAEVTLRLPFVATSGGISVSLATTAAGVASIPASVLIPEGQDSVTFTVTSVNLGTIEIVASRAGASSARTLVYVIKPLVLTVSPTTFDLGTGRTAALTIQSSVSLGTTVDLASSAPSVATVPASVVIPAGNSEAVVQLTGVAEGTATITALATNYAGASAAVTVHQTRLNLPSGVVVTPGMVLPVTLSLTDPAPSGGLVVSLGNASTSVATVPASVTVPAGQSSATFSVTGVSSGATTISAIANGYQSTSMSATVDSVSVKIGSPAIDSMALQVGSGQVFPVTLSRGAPTGGLTLGLSMSDPSKATVSPATLNFPEGATWAGPIVVNGVAKGTTSLSIDAGVAGTLNIPVAVSSKPELVSIPAVVTVGKGFNTAPQEVSISRKIDGIDYAPSQSLTVSLVSSDPAKVKVPDSVTIPVGQSTASFAVTGVDLTSGTPVMFNASASGYGNTGASYGVNVVTPDITLFGIDSVRTAGGVRDEFSLKAGTPGSAYADNQTAAVDLPIILNIVDATPSGIVDGFHDQASGGAPISQLVLHKDLAASGSAFIGVPTGAGTYKVRASLWETSTATSDIVTVSPEAVNHALVFSKTSVIVGYGSKTVVSITRLANNSPFADSVPLIISLTTSDTSKVGIPATVTIPADRASVDFEVSGNERTYASPVSVDAVAQGYTSPIDKMAVTVSETASLSFSHTGSFGLGKGQKMTVGVHREGAGVDGDLVVSLLTSTAGKVTIPSTVTIPNGFDSAAFDIFGGDNPDGTTVSIDAIAPGYNSPSPKLELMVGTPELRFSYSTLGVRPSSNTTGFVYRTVNGYPSMPSEEVVVNLASADSGRVTVASSATIPVNGYAAAFMVNGLQETTADGVAIDASSAGYSVPGRMYVIVGTPRLSFNTDRTVVGIGMQTYGFVQLLVQGATYRATEDIQVNLISSDPAKLDVPSQVTIGQGGNTAYFHLTGIASTGESGATLDAAAARDYGPTVQKTVIVGRPMLRFDSDAISVRKGGKAQVALGHFIEGAEGDSFCRSEEAVVTLTSSNPAKVIVPPLVTIAQCDREVYVDVEGIEDTGEEIVTIDAASPGYAPLVTKPVVSVGTSDTHFEFLWGSQGLGVATGQQATLYISLNNEDGSSFVPTEDVVVNLTSSVAGKISVPSSITIPAGWGDVSFDIFGVADTESSPVTLLASASGYGLGSTRIHVGTPEIRFLQNTLDVGNRLQAMTMLYRFVNGYLFPASDGLTLMLTSSDPSKVAVPASVEMYGFNAYGVPVTGNQLTEGAPTVISVVPPQGYTVNGTLLVNVVAPQLSVTTPAEVPVGSSSNFDVSVSGPGPNYLGEQTLVAPTTINLSNSAPSVLAAPDSVVIPAGAPRISASLKGVAPGSSILTATGAGFQTGISAPITVKP